MRTATACVALGSALVLSAGVATVVHTPPRKPVAVPVAAAGSSTTSLDDIRAAKEAATRSMFRTPLRRARPVVHRPEPRPTHTATPVTSYTSRFGDVTMYCLSGTMADGQPVHSGAIATLDRSIPFGTRITVPGLGTFTVEDRVGYGTDFDVWTPSCATADSWGRHTLRVTISR